MTVAVATAPAISAVMLRFRALVTWTASPRKAVVVPSTVASVWIAPMLTTPPVPL
jgi:hypothetical protein